MARKKKTSPAEDIVAIVAVLPWWAGIVSAIVFYFVLHSMASAPLPTMASRPEQIGNLMVGTLTQSVSAIGQYLLPVFCLIGAAVSASRRFARTQLIENVVKGTGSNILKEMTWQQFEQVVGEAFRLRGYAVVENGGGGADGGIDLVMTKGGEKFVVQCKQWRALKVGVTVVRELYGVMAAGGAAGGFVVTCGQFTEEAKAFAAGRNLVLLDGAELEKMIRQTHAGTAAGETPAPLPQRPGTVRPACPICANAMLLRTAQRGANAGKKFWGCAAYPSCRGLVPVD